MLAGQDGSFLTTDEAGNIKLWRTGACELGLTGGTRSGSHKGMPLAVIDSRLVVIGGNNNLLVSEQHEPR